MFFSLTLKSSHLFGFPLLWLSSITESIHASQMTCAVYGLFHLEFVLIKSWDLFTFKKDEHLFVIKLLKLSKNLKPGFSIAQMEQRLHMPNEWMVWKSRHVRLTIAVMFRNKNYFFWNIISLVHTWHIIFLEKKELVSDLKLCCEGLFYGIIS